MRAPRIIRFLNQIGGRKIFLRVLLEKHQPEALTQLVVLFLPPRQPTLLDNSTCCFS